MAIGDTSSVDYNVFYNMKVKSNNLTIFNGLQLTDGNDTIRVINTNTTLTNIDEIIPYTNAFHNYIQKLYKTQDVRFDFINDSDESVESLHVIGLIPGPIINSMKMSDGVTYHLEAISGEEIPNWTGDPATLFFIFTHN